MMPEEGTFIGLVDVSVTGETLAVELTDGRAIFVPLEWHPRLVHGSHSSQPDR